ncbi:MAG: hypothetical protein R2751_10005 [Bacteroidales bacterium]
MLRTINDLIEIASIEAGTVALLEKEVNVNELIQFLQGYFSPQATDNGIRLTSHLALPDEKAFLLTDEKQAGAGALEPVAQCGGIYPKGGH